MNWKHITVGMYQQIAEIKDSMTDELTTMDGELKIMSVVTGRTFEELDNMGKWEYERLVKELDFLHAEIPKAKPVKRFTLHGKVYEVNYEISEITKGQYDEVVFFAKDGPIKNLNRLMASIITPVKWRFGWKPVKKDHKKLSEEMKDAPFLVAWFAAVFFWNLWLSFLKVTRTSLVEKMMREGTTREEATVLLDNLLNTLDGYTITKR